MRARTNEVHELEPKQIELKIHGLTDVEHGQVPGRVFANKLKQLISALEAADIHTNGKIVHEYVLTEMHMSNPTAVLRAKPLVEDEDGRSPILALNEAIEAITTSDNKVIPLSSIVKRVSLLTAGAEKQFGFGEIRTIGEKVVRIDDFLRKRAVAATAKSRGEWFEGAVHGSFDGTLQYVDNRGAMPLLKLVLSAGGKEIDCVCSRDQIETIKHALSNRVRVTGKAIYSAASPLPVRIMVTQIDPVKQDGDLSRWRGAFTPFQIDSWDGADDA